MSFSQFAGTAIVPTLSRIVLAVAFVSVGYNKVMTQGTFDAAQAKTLQGLGVTVTPAGVAATTPSIVPAAFVQDEEAEPPPEDPTGEEAGADPVGETTEETAEEGAQEPDAGAEPVIPPPDAEAVDPTPVADGAQFEARSLHKITLMCHAQKWPSPTSLAWAAALTELVGGGLLLLGFLSRLWGLALAATMGVAFYLVSMQLFGVHRMSPMLYATEIPRFNTTFNQLGLLVLALGVMLTGPGPASLDRLLFRRAKPAERDIVKPDDVAVVSSGRPM